MMLGGMLAGHDQSGGEIIEKDGKKRKLFYGMSSATAMTKHKGGVAEYRASEGKTVEVPYRYYLKIIFKLSPFQYTIFDLEHRSRGPRNGNDDVPNIKFFRHGRKPKIQLCL